MKNHVTFETAVRLKEAGFPQPTPEAGQIWYDHLGTPFWVQCVFGSIATLRQVGARTHGWDSDMSGKGWVFAQTAADILRELPVGFCIVNFGKFGFGAEFEKHEYIRDQNPQEAAAQAFLNLKAKQ